MQNQRKHQRYNAPDGTLVLADGGISKVVDISKSGLSLMFLDGIHNDIPNELSFDILSKDKIIQAKNIPGKFVWEKKVTFSTLSKIVYTKVGIQFGNLSNKQKYQIDTLIELVTNRSVHF